MFRCGLRCFLNSCSEIGFAAPAAGALLMSKSPFRLRVYSMPTRG
jgi:hypothetical protein